MPDPRPGGPLVMVDRQRDLRPCYAQNGSFLVAGASAKDNEDRDQSSTVPATGWNFTGVPGQEPVQCGRESQIVSPRRHRNIARLLLCGRYLRLYPFVNCQCDAKSCRNASLSVGNQRQFLRSCLTRDAPNRDFQ